MGVDYYKRGNWNKKDDYYTPKILVEPIIKYIPAGSVVWCPFDEVHSEFVICLKAAGFEVLNSHINGGLDFFKYEPEGYDVIISNPPYSKKKEVFQRLFELKKPFAMVMGLPILNYQEVGSFFFEHQEEGRGLQLLVVDKKVSFDGNTASFNSSYFCFNLLPRGLIFHHLTHNNSNKKFGVE